MSALLKIDSFSAASPDKTPLLSDLTLSRGREVVGLVGRNGWGKSTPLAILACSDQSVVHPATGLAPSPDGRVWPLAFHTPYP